MPVDGSSGRGNSFGLDFVQCARFGYYKHVMGVVRPGPPPVAPHVGTACHAFFDRTFKAFDAGIKKDAAKEGAFTAFEAVLGEGDDGMDLTELEERAGKARRDILPVWFETQWDKLERKVEVTIATEVSFEFYLPNLWYAPPVNGSGKCFTICKVGCRGAEEDDEHKAVCLRRVTGRIDRVLRREPDVFDEVDAVLNEHNPLLSRNGLSVQDFKSTSARSLKTYVADYLRSDQHLIYLLGWNRAHLYGGAVEAHRHTGSAYPEDNVADELLYSMVRVDPSIKSISASDFHDEPRLVQEAQLDDAFERLCALRAKLTARWHEPPVMWEANTSPSGPCNKFGHPCEYNQLCDQPTEWDKLISPLDATHRLDEAVSGYDYILDPKPSPV